MDWGRAVGAVSEWAWAWRSKETTEPTLKRQLKIRYLVS
jgi:hypothetical protein